MDQITRSLIDRLVEKGVEVNIIPAYIRDLANTIARNDFLCAQELCKKMESLGWDEFELDDHTLQLFLATFEIGPVNRFYSEQLPCDK